MVHNLTLRFANEEDTPLILQLIKDLAAYEKLSSDVVTDETTMKESLFRGRKVAEVLIWRIGRSSA